MGKYQSPTQPSMPIGSQSAKYTLQYMLIEI